MSNDRYERIRKALADIHQIADAALAAKENK